MIPDRIVQRDLLRSYLIDGLNALTHRNSYDEALHTLLKPDDRILLKFNSSAAREIGTSDAMTVVLTMLLIEAGFDPSRIMVLEGGETRDLPYKTMRPDTRWQAKAVNFGRCGSDSFMAALDQATAIINIPFLKSHHLATMTGCMKNLSHGLIRHPARFHVTGCDPAIAEIVATPNIRNKLKLNIVNGLRVVFDKGPEATAKQIDSPGYLLMGADPVACDLVGYGLINGIRRARQMKPLLEDEQLPRQIITAAELGLGNYDEDRIILKSLSA